MTILQTLLTKNVSVEGVTLEKGNGRRDKNTESIQKDKNEKNLIMEEIDEDQKRCRNLLGFKIRGRINREDLELRYNERMKNYTDQKLSE